MYEGQIRGSYLTMFQPHTHPIISLWSTCLNELPSVSTVDHQNHYTIEVSIFVILIGIFFKCDSLPSHFNFARLRQSRFPTTDILSLIWKTSLSLNNLISYEILYLWNGWSVSLHISNVFNPSVPKFTTSSIYVWSLQSFLWGLQALCVHVPLHLSSFKASWSIFVFELLLIALLLPLSTKMFLIKFLKIFSDFFHNYNFLIALHLKLLTNLTDLQKSFRVFIYTIYPQKILGNLIPLPV